jgi:branched-chain amino acid transport system permease protein
MQQLLLFVCLGLGSGALIAGISLSVVVNYRGTGAINIAAGATAMLGGYFFYGLKTSGYLFFSWLSFGGPMGTIPALAITLAVSAVLGLLLDVLVYRPLRDAPPLAKLVPSVGVLIALQAAVTLRFGGNGQLAPNVVGGGGIQMLGGIVPSNRFIIAGIVLVLALALASLYRFTRFGLATRAAQENETEAALAGLSPNTLSAVNSMLAAVTAAALGVVAAPLTQLDPNTIALMVIPALGAALLANFSSFMVAALAGLGMGIIEAVVIYLQTKSWYPTAQGQPIPGVPDLIFFLVIAGALFWRGNSLPVRGALVEPRLPPAPAPRRVVRPTVILSVIVVLCLLVFPFDFRQALINTVIGAIAALSLVTLTGYVGQVSFVQYALAGVCGFAVSRFALQAGIGFPFGPMIGVFIATAIGVVAAIPAVRVRGVNLALLTLAGAVAIENFLFNNPNWGGGANGSPVPPPHLLGLSLGPAASFPINGSDLPSPVFGFLCLVAMVALALVVASLRRTTLGHRMLAVRSSERAAAGIGITPRYVKLLAFGLSSAIAAIAGVLYAYNFGSVDPTQFGIANGLGVIAFAYIGGITTVSGAIVAGMLTTEGVMSHILEKWVGIPINYQLLFAGVALAFTVITNPQGIALSDPPKWTNRLKRRFTGTASTETEATPAASPLIETKVAG